MKKRFGIDFYCQNQISFRFFFLTKTDVHNFAFSIKVDVPNTAFCLLKQWVTLVLFLGIDTSEIV